MYIQGSIEQTISQASNTSPVLLITGARQIGKTTILQHIAGNSRQYVSLDNPRIRLLAKEDRELFMQTYQPPIIIDEIEYAPELFAYLPM